MEAAAAAVKRNPASLELRFLHAMLLMSLGRYQEAERALRQVLFLDRTLAVAHFALGTTLRRTGDLVGARRSYANAAEIAGGLAAETVLPLADGEQAGELARAARDQLVAMEGLQ
jgi:chemotaxis protein methyltransferase CheR